MLSVKHFKMQVQKPLVKRSFYCSAHVQDIILVYLIPTCRGTMTKTLVRNYWGQSGKLDDRGDICHRIPTPILHSIPLFMVQPVETE